MAVMWSRASVSVGRSWQMHLWSRHTVDELVQKMQFVLPTAAWWFRSDATVFSFNFSVTNHADGGSYSVNDLLWGPASLRYSSESPICIDFLCWSRMGRVSWDIQGFLAYKNGKDFLGSRVKSILVLRPYAFNRLGLMGTGETLRNNMPSLSAGCYTNFN